MVGRRRRTSCPGHAELPAGRLWLVVAAGSLQHGSGWVSAAILLLLQLMKKGCRDSAE